MQLRPYQGKSRLDIYQAWEYVKNVLLVLPTRSGKTVVFGSILSDHVGASCAIAHRSELVSQISMALANFGIMHRVIGNKSLIRWLCQLHIIEYGKSFYDPNAQCAVASVDTLIRREDQLKDWMQQVTLWVIDEAHHLQKNNKWGRATELFPNAKGLGVTATACRADGRGLGRHSDGVIDTLILGPTHRELIVAGYICKFKIYAPPSNLDLSSVNITASGDLNQKKSSLQVRKSTIMGDVVKHYLRLAPGKLGITFAPDVLTATEFAAGFNASGVPAEVVSAKTPDTVRIEIIRRFKNRELLQLVNVDLFGEGFDLPALEVVSMARPTESFGLFCQQFARCGTITNGKNVGIIIDHVGNVAKHARTEIDQVTGEYYISLDREYSLDRRETRRSERDPDLIPVRTCIECMGVYEAIYKICPYCHCQWVPAGRATPEQVGGDLCELDAAVLADMRGEIQRIDMPAEQIKVNMEHGGAPPMAAGGAAKNHRLRQEAQGQLREAIAMWGGIFRGRNIPDSESYKRFYFKFGIDVMTAQTLGRPDAEKLTIKINQSIGRAAA